jgi:soluble lytic murein transglycosylase-like protein
MAGLGLRQRPERRHNARRSILRWPGERRRSDRRRSRLRTLALAAVTFLTLPHHRGPSLRPRVSVSVEGFRALPPNEAYESFIQEAAAAYRLDPALIRAVMRTESAFNPLIVSPVGAEGLMQLMPAVAEELGVRDSFDPRDNIMGGARYLRELLDRHRGNLKLALASYNAGPGAVERYHDVPPFRETQRYVKAITGLIKRNHVDPGND